MSFREPFIFPYVTSNIPRWPPTPVASDRETDEYVLKPSEDPAKILNSYPVVHLQRGSTYYWHDVDITKSVTIYGNGATIRCPYVSYCLKITAAGTRIFDCKFVGRSLSRDSSDLEENGRFAIWVSNGHSIVLQQCAFIGFSDGAVCYYVNGVTKTGRHLVERCVFDACKAGLVLVCESDDMGEGGLVSNCRFNDCMFGIYAVSMFGWNVRDCFFDKTRSGIYHVKKSLMSYGSALVGVDPVGALGLVTGCFFRSAVNSEWGDEFSLRDNPQSTVKLAGYYFDDETSVPVRLSDCVFLDSDIALGNICKSPKCCSVFITGCVFWFSGSGGVSSFDIVRRLDGTGAADGSDACFEGCSGREKCKTSGLYEDFFEDANMCDGLKTTINQVVRGPVISSCIIKKGLYTTKTVKQ